MIYLFDAELWLWDARQSDSWTFLQLPEDASAEIREIASAHPRGFGSVKVTATIGGTVWRTSIAVFTPTTSPSSGAAIAPTRPSGRPSSSATPWGRRSASSTGTATAKT